MGLASYGRVVGELTLFLELFCVGWRRLQADWAAQQGSVQSTLIALAYRGKGGRLGDGKKADA